MPTNPSKVACQLEWRKCAKELLRVRWATRSNPQPLERWLWVFGREQVSRMEFDRVIAIANQDVQISTEELNAAIDSFFSRHGDSTLLGFATITPAIAAPMAVAEAPAVVATPVAGPSTSRTLRQRSTDFFLADDETKKVIRAMGCRASKCV